MKIGMITDSLPGTDVESLVTTAARLELDMLEFGCGNWSSAPHVNLDRMIDSDAERRNFKARLDAHGIAISALNCSGNPLHPGEHGRRHDAVTRGTIKLASLMGIDRVVMMSGCPGAPGDASANWITTEWPPEVREILRWQWDEVLIPYWRDLVAYANGLGVHKLCLELHGHQNVYNVRTLQKLRDAVGPTVGANLDLVVPTNCVALALERSRKFLYTCAVRDRRCLGPSSWILGVRAARGSQADVIAAVPRLVKIASAQQIARLVKEAQAGLPLEHLPAPPSAVAARPGAQYFLVRQQGALWDTVLKSADIGIYIPEALADAELELLVVVEPAGSGRR